MKERKRYTMLVTVTAPYDMPAASIRREVRTLISEQCNYAADPGDIKAVRVTAPAAPY